MITELRVNGIIKHYLSASTTPPLNEHLTITQNGKPASSVSHYLVNYEL